MNGNKRLCEIFLYPVAHTSVSAWHRFHLRTNQIKAEHDVLIQSIRNVSASIQMNTTLLSGYGLNTYFSFYKRSKNEWLKRIHYQKLSMSMLL